MQRSETQGTVERWALPVSYLGDRHHRRLENSGTLEHVQTIDD